MTIQLTPLEMMQALRFGYHRQEIEYLNSERLLDISEEQAKKQLIERVCTHIIGMKIPIVVLVSGGVDSSFMLRMAYECFSMDKIVTVGMDNPEAYYNFHPKKEWIEETLASVNRYTYKDLFFSSSLVVTQKIYARAIQYGNTILIGDGGDELFCGYDKYLLPDFSLAKLLGRRGRKLINYLSTGYEGAMTTPIDLSLFKTGYPKSKRERMLYDISTELRYIEIPKVETAMRMSGTNNMICAPFLKTDVFDFCLSLPLKYKYRFGARKVLLRKILRENGVYPPHRKTGFALPVEWIGNELNWSLMVLNKLMEEGMVEIIPEETA